MTTKVRVSKVTRRDCLAQVHIRRTTNASLWLHKFIRDQESGGESRRLLVQETAGIPQPEFYLSWFNRWKKSLEECGARCREAEVIGRMVIGLGEDSVLETSITLHHTLGVPYIPGTALKGLATAFARQQLGDDWSVGQINGAYSIMFGNTDNEGYVTFFDAMPLPNKSELLPDVITVHHVEYYNDGTLPPADWDSPNPVPFLSANGRYLLALLGPEEWVEAAFDILTYALETYGAGAKTSSGYGRLKVAKQSLVSSGQREVDSLIRKVKAVGNNAVAGSINHFYKRWKQLDVNAEEKRRAAEAIVAKVREAGHEKKIQDKEWYRELLTFLE